MTGGGGGRPARGPRYFVAEGLQGFRRNGVASLAAVVVTVVALFALGSALVLAGAADHLARSLARQVRVVAYLRDGLDGAEVFGLRGRLGALPGVAGVAYVSKQAALAGLRRSVGGRVDFHDLLSHNPLPASFVLTVDGPARLGPVAAAARALPGVEDVSYSALTVDRLLAFTRSVRVAGGALGGVLALVALVVIAGTIRLTVFARRAEIEVMRLVGATAWFIRWPFVVEGALTGACGAAAAFAITAGLYALAARSAHAVLPFLALPSPEQVALGLAWKLLLWGVLIGVVGSLLAVRRHLRV